MRKAQAPRLRIAVGALALAVLTTRPALAENLVLMGVEAAQTNNYEYVGFIIPLEEGSLGSGWVMRHWFDHLAYQYQSGNDTTIKAQSYAYSPAIGKGIKGDGWTVTGYLGVVARHTGLTPNDPTNKNAGDRYRPYIQIDATARVAERVESQTILQGTAGELGYYARERLMYSFDSGYVAGAEAIAKGSTEYHGWQAGLVVGGFKLGDKGFATVRGGVAGQKGESLSGYGALEIGFPF